MKVGYREQPQIMGKQPLPWGKGGLWLWDVQYWGRVGMQVWSLAASISSVPVLLHRCLRCLYGFPLHPHRLVLGLSWISRGPQMWVGEGGYCGCNCLFYHSSRDRLSQGPRLFKI